MRPLGRERWVRRVQMFTLYTGASFQWRRRVQTLGTKYGVTLPTLNDLWGTSLGPKALRERVRVAETQRWEENARIKPSLRTYSAHEETISRENSHDNSCGSSLLFEACSGTLRTHVWWAKCGRQGQVWCAACKEEERRWSRLCQTVLGPFLPSSHPQNIKAKQSCARSLEGPL